MEKRYRFRIYPTRAQEEQIQRNFGCVRFVYNYFLAKRMEKYDAGEGIYGYYDACKDLTALKRTPGYEWLKEADAHSLQNALKNMNFAYLEFYRRVRERSGAPGFPKFKSKKESRRSYTSQAQVGKRVIYIDVERNRIMLPKLGLVECRGLREVEGRILSASVAQVASGKYFVSVCCTEYEPEPLPATGKQIGLHLGIRSLAVGSNGETFDNERYRERAQKRLARLHRRLSRKPSGSANREKARLALANAYERITNQRSDKLHKLSAQLVRDYDVICVRADEISKMVKRAPFGYYLTDAAWGEFIRQLAYKSEWNGRKLVKVQPGFPSAQLCSACGYKNAEQANRSEREWECSKCGARHNRAVNAAINTLNEGMKI